MLSRRSFLVTGSLTVAAGALAPTLAQTNQWDRVRAEFDLDPAFTHASLFYMTPHPRAVRNAVEAYRRQLDANPFLTVEHGLFEQEKPYPVRTAAAIAGYIGASTDEIALTPNTTTGLSIVYHGLPLQAGDEILTTAHDHYVHHESIRLAAERAGATWRKVALFDSHDAISADQIVDRIRKAVGPKTRVVGVTWVHSSTGLKLPIARIAAAVKEVNPKVILVVDGVHGIGVEDPKTVTQGADVFVAGTHKWIFAPRGTGFVWARPQVWATMRPLIPTFSAFEPFMAWADEKRPDPPARASWFTPGGFQAFEHWWAVPAAIEFHRAIGPAKITDRIHSLNAMVKDELAKMPHVVLYTPRSRDLSSGIVCFDVKGKAQNEVVRILHDRDHILASTSPYKVSYARVAFGIANNEAEVEKTVKAIRALA